MTISLAPTAIAETTLKDPAEADQNLRISLNWRVILRCAGGYSDANR